MSILSNTINDLIMKLTEECVEKLDPVTQWQEADFKRVVREYVERAYHQGVEDSDSYWNP